MLTKESSKVLFTKDLIAEYKMPVFAIDLLKDAYKTNDPFELQKLTQEIFDINLDIQTIIELLHEEDTSSRNFLKFEDL